MERWKETVGYLLLVNDEPSFVPPSNIGRGNSNEVHYEMILGTEFQTNMKSDTNPACSNWIKRKLISKVNKIVFLKVARICPDMLRQYKGNGKHVH